MQMLMTMMMVMEKAVCLLVQSIVNMINGHVRGLADMRGWQGTVQYGLCFFYVKLKKTQCRRSEGESTFGLEYKGVLVETAWPSTPRQERRGFRSSSMCRAGRVSRGFRDAWRPSALRMEAGGFGLCRQRVIGPTCGPWLRRAALRRETEARRDSPYRP